MIKELTLDNVKIAGRRTFSGLDEINLIRGDNTTGKTAILDGIELALTGGHHIGKTNQAVMKLAAAEQMAAEVVTETGTLRSEWVRSKAGAVKQVAGKSENDFRFVGATEFFEATNKGRFALLATDPAAAELEASIADAAADRAQWNKFIKRISESIKTIELEIGGLELPDDVEAFEAEVIARKSSRLTARNAIAALSDAGRADGELPGDDLAEKSADALEADAAELHRMIVGYAALERVMPTAEQELGAAQMAEDAIRDAEALEEMRKEWQAAAGATDIEALVQARDEAQARSIALQAAVKALEGMKGCMCPTCGQAVTKAHHEALAAELETVRVAGASLLQKVRDAECPVTSGEVDAANARMVRAIQTRDNYSKIRTPANLAELELLPQFKIDLEAIEAEGRRRRINGERVTYRQWTQRNEETRAWFVANDGAITAVEAFRAATVRLGGLAGELGSGQRSEKAAAELLESLKLQFATACAQALGTILEAADYLICGIVEGTVINVGMEVMIQRGGDVIPWDVMAGAEQLAIGTAVKAALSTVDGIVLVDEFGVLSDTNQRIFISNMMDAIQAGRIKQAFIVVPDKGDLDINSFQSKAETETEQP